VGPRVSLGSVEKRKFLTLPGLEIRPLGRPAMSYFMFEKNSERNVSYHLSKAEPTVCLLVEAARRQSPKDTAPPPPINI
jgi:hypothetical protein